LLFSGDNLSSREKKLFKSILFAIACPERRHYTRRDYVAIRCRCSVPAAGTNPKPSTLTTSRLVLHERLTPTRQEKVQPPHCSAAAYYCQAMPETEITAGMKTDEYHYG